MMGSFRQSMTWLHTWCGLVVGWALFAIFLSGALAVFRHEIDYWMTPELQAPLAGDLVAVSQRSLQELAPGAARWVIDLPSNRAPVLRLRWPAGPKQRLQSRYIDAEGRSLSPRETAGGSMLYRFHYGLLMGRTGMWMVGGLAMAMLVALLTGIIIHAKIFREFFTFRPFAPAPRAWLDAHTLCSVAVLPFSLMISYSGLVIWWFIWLPGGLDLAYAGERAAFFREMAPPGFSRVESAEARAPLAALSQIVAAARADAPADLAIGSITVSNPGRADARVDVTRVSDAALWGISDRLRFDGVSGALLERLPEQGAPAFVAHRIFRILHEIKFAGPGLRWMFFAMAAVSCAAIATGTVLWSAKRRARHAKAVAMNGSRLGTLAAFGVEALNVGVIAGMVTATGVYFAANRLIPSGWPGRADWEVSIFFLTWLGCALAALAGITIRRQALGRPDTAQQAMRGLWGAQWAVAAAVAVALPPLDQLTTGGVASAWARGDAVVLAFHGAALAAALAMATLARRNLRPLHGGPPS